MSDICYKCVVVIPTYSERENIERMLDAVLAQPEGFDVLVVDDGSPDGTADVVGAYAEGNSRVCLLSRTGARGLGLSYVDGFQWALDHGYDRVFEMDADFSHNPDDLGSLFRALDDHDMALGSRYVGGRVSVLNWPLHRLALSVCAGAYVRRVAGMRLWDPTSGFRGFRSDVLRSVGLDTIKSNGYCFQVEMLHRASRCGFDIVEVQIVFAERREGQSKMNKGVILESAMMPWRLRFRPFRPNSGSKASDKRASVTRR